MRHLRHELTTRPSHRDSICRVAAERVRPPPIAEHHRRIRSTLPVALQPAGGEHHPDGADLGPTQVGHGAGGAIFVAGPLHQS